MWPYIVHTREYDSALKKIESQARPTPEVNLEVVLMSWDRPDSEGLMLCISRVSKILDWAGPGQSVDGRRRD